MELSDSFDFALKSTAIFALFSKGNVPSYSLPIALPSMRIFYASRTSSLTNDFLTLLLMSFTTSFLAAATAAHPHFSLYFFLFFFPICF